MQRSQFFRANRRCLNFVKKCGILPYLTLAASWLQAEPAGIIGGTDQNNMTPYLGLVSSSGVVSSATGALPIGPGFINSVAINPTGTGIIGGADNGFNTPYIGLVSSSGVVSSATGPGLPIGMGQISSVAINSTGAAIIGGVDNTNAPYAALVSSTGVVSSLTGPGLPTGTGLILSVAINPTGAAIIGGNEVSSSIPYAALVSSTGAITSLTGAGLPSGNGIIGSVAINPTGAAIIGGSDSNFNTPYAALVSSTGVASSLTGAGLPIGNGAILGVAITPTGAAIIVGSDSAGPGITPYAALVSSTGVVSSLTGPGLPTGSGQILSVAINPTGAAIIGGNNVFFSTPYAALVSPTGAITSLTGAGLPSLGDIVTVAISSTGAALIGGDDNGAPYVALVSPTGVVSLLTGIGLPSGSGGISSVAIIDTILPLLSNIPTASLQGNNLIYANYINTFAPQDAFYFVPSVLDGTLSAALESAAPTRNAVALYTASNNLFNLTTSLATHLRNQGAIRTRKRTKKTQTSHTSVACATEEWKSDDQLIAASGGQFLSSSSWRKKDPPTQNNQWSEQKKNPYTLWFDLIGLLAYQKAQSQTPAFNPSTLGGIVAFDAMVTENSRVGGGAAYLFTHIHEKQDAGHSTINQENLFTYASWDNQRFYIDGSLFAALFQINQVRTIHMTGFDFTSSSHPNGWQLLPHLEVGLNKNNPRWIKSIEFTANPFVMLDWANAWQDSYKEKGNSPFNAAQKNHYSSLLRTEVGIRLYETVAFDSWNLTFQEKGSYVNTQSYGTGKVHAFLVGSPGSFTVETLSSAQNLGVGQFAVIFDPINNHYPTSTIFYQGEFGEHYQSHQVNVEFSWSF